jgi:hypothetical protein
MNSSSVKSERKKTPAEATPFELNQLRFFLAAAISGQYSLRQIRRLRGFRSFARRSL